MHSIFHITAYDDRDLHFAGTLPAGGESLWSEAMCESPTDGWTRRQTEPKNQQGDSGSSTTTRTEEPEPQLGWPSMGGD